MHGLASMGKVWQARQAGVRLVRYWHGEAGGEWQGPDGNGVFSWVMAWQAWSGVFW